MVKPYVIEYACGKQAVIGGLVNALPHLKCDPCFPPFAVLMFVNHITLERERV